EDVAFSRQIYLQPRGRLVKLNVHQADDGGCRQPGNTHAEQRCQSLGEVAGRDTLQVKDRKQRLDRFRAAHVGRQDRRREPESTKVSTSSVSSWTRGSSRVMGGSRKSR